MRKGDFEDTDLVEVIKRSIELKKELQEEEFNEKCTIASKILKEIGIDHKDIQSVTCNIHKEGIPYISIWYRNSRDNIIGIVLEHHGSWKIHIHNGVVID